MSETTTTETLSTYVWKAGTQSTTFAVVDRINALAAEGTVYVDGFRVDSRFSRRPASVAGNGTLSVAVHAKKAGATRYLYFKEGTRVPSITTTN